MSGMNTRRYKAKAQTWGLGETKNGNPQVAVLFSILTENAPESALTWHGYFSEKTADRTLQSLRHCGWVGDDVSNLTGLDTNEVELVVEDEEYEGKVSAKVQWVNRASSLALSAPMTPDKAKAFAATMREKVRALDASQGVKSNGASKPRFGAEPPPHTDSDNEIPF